MNTVATNFEVQTGGIFTQSPLSFYYMQNNLQNKELHRIEDMWNKKDFFTSIFYAIFSFIKSEEV